MIPVRMPDYSIGVDLGGTNLRAAAIDRGGTMLDKISGSTKFTEGREAVLADIASAISTLRERHGTAGLGGGRGGGPGVLSKKGGVLTRAPQTPPSPKLP